MEKENTGMHCGIDMMGGDDYIDGKHYPHYIRAAEALARASKDCGRRVKLIAYGDEPKVKDALSNFSHDSSKIEFRHCPDAFPMGGTIKSHGSANTTIKAICEDLKPANSNDGKLDFGYSSGNSAATVFLAWRFCKPIATFLYRGKHLQIHPSLVTKMPYDDDKFFYINDVGANKNPEAIDLFASAIFSKIYAQAMQSENITTIGMLDSPLAEKASEYFKCLEKGRERYVGITTPKDVFDGKCNVVAIDGFRGNIFLKTAEAVANAIRHRVKHATLVQKLRDNDALLINKFSPEIDKYGLNFKTAEYYNTVWAQVRELLAKKPSGNIFSRLDDFFTRIPGRQQYLLISGNTLDEIAKKTSDVLANGRFKEQQYLGDAFDTFSYSTFLLFQKAYFRINHKKIPGNAGKPTVFVLSNGEEDVKGDVFAQQLKKAIPGCIGFAEPEHLIKGKISRKGKKRLYADYPIDIVVSDRYTADMYSSTLKAIEEKLGHFFKGLLTMKNLYLYSMGTGPLQKLRDLLNTDNSN
ncbi:MAG: hypothetical protein QW666_03320, partial [Candidatus Woesearchaeota archaeon]